MNKVLLFFLLLSSSVLNAQFCFYPHAEYAVGTNTNTKNIAYGDFNNDNKIDIAMAIVTPSMVSILLGDGTGQFTLASSYTMANTQPYDIVTNDFNGDNKLDVAVANNGSALQGMSVLLGDGSGGITTAYSYTTTGTNPAGIATADFNGDNKADLAICNFNSSPGTVTVRFGVGNGTMGSASTYTVGTQPGAIIAADVVNDDGKADLAVANVGSNNVTVLWNVNGTGSFQSVGNFSTSPGTGPRSLVAADLNGDTKLDIITGNSTSSNVSVLLKINASQFSSSNVYAAGVNPADVKTADFDGDGKPDIVAANNNSDAVSVLRGDGAGGLITPALSFATAAKPVKMVAADFNNDGKPDIATANQNVASNNTSVLINSLPGPIVVSGNSTICVGDAATLSASGATSYIWSTTATTSAIVVSPTTTSSYTATGTNTGCLVTATGAGTVSVNALPAVTASSTTLSAGCAGTAATLTGGGALSYAWTGGVTDGVGFIAPVTTDYTVTGTDANSCTNTATITITVDTIPPAPSICLVTVDSASSYNIIAWEKNPTTDNVDSFIVYREITTNNYARIGAVSYDSLSWFIDTVRTKYFPNTGDPNAGTYRYKLQIRDSCGYYSPLGNYHNTIYSVDNNGTFTWPQLYTIENTPNPVSSYVLFRDDSSNGNWQAIANVAGTQQAVADPLYTLYKNIASWRVQTSWAITCTVSVKNAMPMGTNLNLSKSNVNRNSSPTGLNDGVGETSISIFPNPASEMVYITMDQDAWLEIFTVSGKKLTGLNLSSGLNRINVDQLEPGVYLLRTENHSGITHSKMIITKH